MSKTVLVLTGALALMAAVGANDGVVGMGDPEFYGRLELGDRSPRPEVYFEEPRLAEPVAAYQEPIYLRIRPQESLEWELHCSTYEACARYVYFVNEEWYLAVYVPYYRDRWEPHYDDGETDSARRAEEYRKDHRNDEPNGEPGGDGK